MSSLSPRLQVRVQQKQILTPGLVQMVSLLQLNRLELKDMISAEVAQNPVLEEATRGRRRTDARGIAAAARSRASVGDPADQSILEVTAGPVEVDGVRWRLHDGRASISDRADGRMRRRWEPETGASTRACGADSAETPEAPRPADPFDEIDFGSYFDDYLDPGYKSPASENVEKPSFETFLSSPVTLARSPAFAAGAGRPERRRSATRRRAIIGNLDENGYLTSTAEEIAGADGHEPADDGGSSAGGPYAGSGGGGRGGSARMPAAADRKPQRQGRRGVADRRTII